MTAQNPQWLDTLVQRYTAGVAHGFIIHFNVSDYVIGSTRLREALAQLLGKREIVVFYNRSAGLEFASASMEQRFREMLELDEAQEAGNAGLMAALGVGQQSAQPQQQPLPRNPAQVLPLLERLLKMGNAAKGEKVAAVIIDYAESIAPEGNMGQMSAEDRTNLITLQRWGKDSVIAASGNPIVLVTASLTDLNSDIRAASSKYEAIEIGLPNWDARMSFVEEFMSGEVGFESKLDAQQIVNATAGLGLLHIEDIFLRAEQEGQLTWELIKERKDSIIDSEYGEVIEVMEPRYGFEAIGGLEHVKRFFENNVVRPIREARYQRVPMGVLMTGPAGTGKSVAAEAVAYECGINAVRLDLSKILGSYVGESERNLEKALRMIDSLAPTMVFIDEIDQAVSRNTGGGDSGVSARIFKRLLEHMSDTQHRGKVIYLAATNRPDLMDAALRRPGRFDKKIPFLIPDDTERAAIFEVMCKRYNLDAQITAAAVRNTEGWTGAEIEAVVVKAWELVEDFGMHPDAAIEEATMRLSPSTSDIEYMTKIAIAECNDTDLLPDRFKEQARNRQQLERDIETLRPAEQRGKRAL